MTTPAKILSFSPYAYWQLHALSEIAIADAAREFGFHHLGNFAADYRRLFGMRPSKTDRLT